MLAFDAIESLKGIGTPECHRWRGDIFRRHMGIAPYLIKTYRRINEDAGYIEANRWLLTLNEGLKLGGTGLKLDDDLDTLTSYCKAKARKTERQIFETVRMAGKKIAPGIIRRAIEKTGVSFPLGETYTKDELIAALARVVDEKWWKGKLRPWQWQRMEDTLRQLGFVSKCDEIYLSNYSLCRRQTQKRENRKLMERMEAENQDGQSFTLLELAELSPSNPIVRRAELMVRMRGFEDFASHSPETFQGLFITLTCPSKYHATLSTGHPNPNYSGATVSEAQDYLNRVWRRTRAAFHRSGITPFGMRVVEPHHDGTPHWHLMLFFPRDQVNQAAALFRHYAFQEDGNEPGADKHRLKIVQIDPDKGSATGYVAKYIAKNIDGYQVDTDHYGRDAVESAVRIEAWASIHGIHQFEQVGGASITVWRELRRLASSDLEPGLLQKLTQAADSGDWAAYNELMGGVICPMNQRPVRPMMIEKPESNRYGEAVRVIKGLWYGLAPIVTRINDWVIRVRDAVPHNESEDGVGDGAGFSTAPPGDRAPLEFCQ